MFFKKNFLEVQSQSLLFSDKGVYCCRLSSWLLLHPTSFGNGVFPFLFVSRYFSIFPLIFSDSFFTLVISLHIYIPLLQISSSLLLWLEKMYDLILVICVEYLSVYILICEFSHLCFVCSQKECVFCY